MEVDRTYRTVTFQSSCGTYVAISISAEWIWRYLKDFDYVLSLPILKQSVIPKIIEFCYHYLEEPMTEIPHSNSSNSNLNVYCGMMIHSLVQPWYASFLSHLCGSPEIRGELLIASRILQIQPLEDLIGTTLPFPYKKYALGELRAIFAECYSKSQHQKRKMEGQCNGSRKR